MRGNVGDSLIGSIRESFYAAAAFLPNFIAGIIILLIGIIVGSIVKRIVVSVFASLHLEAYLHKYGIPEVRKITVGPMSSQKLPGGSSLLFSLSRLRMSGACLKLRQS